MKTQEVILLITALTGLVGATSGLMSGLIAYMSYRRKSGRVKVKGSQGVRLMNASPPYSENKIYSSITCFNRGEKDTSIAQAGEKSLFQFGGAIYSDSMMGGVKILKADNWLDFLAEEKKGSIRPHVGYYFVKTASGRTFKHYPNTAIVYALAWPVRRIRHRLGRQKKDKT